jgi:phosphate-selective porin OprO/OprP
MRNGMKRKWIVLLLMLFSLGLLWPAERVMAGKLSDLQNEIEESKKKNEYLQRELNTNEKRTAELEERVSKIEAKQRLKEKSLTEEVEQTAQKKREMGPTDYRAFWKEGINFTTQDGQFKARVGGRIQNDWAWIGEDNDLKASVGEQEDGTEFRRARLYVSGLIYDNVEFKMQFDFAGGDVAFKDVYLGLTDLPFGKIRAGHFKEPFSLEELTSSKYTTFLERALPNAFAPSRNTGVMLHGTALTASDPRMTWAVGAFRDTPDEGDIRDSGGYNFTGRLTWLPWYEDDGASLLHLGGAFSHRNPNDNTARFRSRPEAHLTDRFVDTGSFTSTRVDLVGLEAAWVSGPLSLQGEYVFANAEIASSAKFSSYYAQVSYFLTGEHRKYKPSAGAFSRVKPEKNYRFDSGPGAWEIAVRYSELDLNDSGISGGALSDISVGLNWYLNPNMKIMWNYVHAELSSVGQADMAMMRLQVDF